MIYFKYVDESLKLISYKLNYDCFLQNFRFFLIFFQFFGQKKLGVLCKG